MPTGAIGNINILQKQAELQLPESRLMISLPALKTAL